MSLKKQNLSGNYDFYNKPTILFNIRIIDNSWNCKWYYVHSY